MNKLHLILLLTLLLYPFQISGEPTVNEVRGSAELNHENNWVFGVRTDTLPVGSQIILIWRSNGTATGWISCSNENQVAAVNIVSEIGYITLSNSEEKTCGVTIYRVYKPIDNSTIYSIYYIYSWSLENPISTNEESIFEMVPFAIGVISCIIFRGRIVLG